MLPLIGIRRPAALIASAAALSTLGLSACDSTNPEPTPTVRFVSPAMNSTVGPDVLVKVATTHFSFSALAAGKVSASANVSGHIHLFLDRPTGLDADAIQQMSKADTVTLKGLAVGEHYLLAQGAEAGHDDIDGMVDSVAFTVAAP